MYIYADNAATTKTSPAAAEAMVHKRDVFEPDMEQNRIYRRLYEEVFKNIYGRLSGLYERLQEIYQEEEDKIMI